MAAYLGGGRSDPASPAFLVPEAVALVMAVLFVRHTARARSPFISLRFLAGRGFGVMNLLNFLYGAAVLGFGPLVPLCAQNRYGLAPLAAGTVLTARAVGMVTVAGLAVFMLRRTGDRRPMAVGFALTIAGIAATALSPHGLTPYAWLAVTAGVCGAGMGIARPSSNNAMLQLAPESAASVAGLRGMFRQSGAITAVAITTSILARSSDPGLQQARIFLVFAVVMAAALPLILLVPDHRGRW
jgi:MFS family permease